jgi:hypothetical protein
MLLRAVFRVTASCRPVPALVFLKTIPPKSTFAAVLMPTILSSETTLFIDQNVAP